MTQNQQVARKPATPGPFSRWIQRKMNARMNRKIRRGRGTFMGTVPVTPHRLDGADREQAWRRIVAAQPRYGTYQSKSDREYPVIRLTPR
jgi:hypothetical protein